MRLVDGLSGRLLTGFCLLIVMAEASRLSLWTMAIASAKRH
jgi:hypothetical protein